MARILVTDGDQRASLAITRSLGSAGHGITIVSPDGRSLAGASRFAERDIAAPHPLSFPQAFAARVAEISEENDVLIPVTEPALLALLPLQETLSCVLPFPSAETFRRASDKAWVTTAAAKAGLTVPDQVVLASPEEMEPLLAHRGDSATSWVLKPGRSVASGRKLSVSYSLGGDALMGAVRNLPPEAFPLLVQQRVRGPGCGVFLLRWNGRILAAFAHRRIREKPPSGGVSVLRESVPLDPDLLEGATRLLDALNWQGVAMVEFKIDTCTGTAFVMEINGRFWGSLQLAIDAGVDFPRLLVQAALGNPAAAPPEYKIGIRSRWLLGDVDHLLARILRSPERLNLPPDSPGRGQALREFLAAFHPQNRVEVFRWTDLRPFLHELRLWMRSIAL